MAEADISASIHCKKKELNFFASTFVQQQKITALGTKGGIYELLIRLQVQNQILQITEYSEVTKMSGYGPTPTFYSTSLRTKFVYAQSSC